MDLLPRARAGLGVRERLLERSDVLGRADRNELLVHEHLRHHAGVFELTHGDDHRQFAAQQTLFEEIRVGDGNLKTKILAGRRKLRKALRQPILPDAFNRTDVELRVCAMLAVAHIENDFLELLELRQELLQKDLPLRRQDVVATLALEQPKAKLAFERMDLQRDRWLREPQRLRRLGGGTHRGDMGKDAQALQAVLP